MKATAPKLALMKGTYLYMLHDLWLSDIPIDEERHITTFTKAFRHQIRNTEKQHKKEKKQNKMHF